MTLNSDLIDFSTDPFTGRNPSYCFVELSTREQADQAITQLTGRNIRGRDVKVKAGVAKSPYGSSPRRQQKQQLHRRWDAAYRQDGSSLTTFATFDRWRRGDPNPPRKDLDSHPSRVYLGGLPRITDRERIARNIVRFFDGLQVYVSSFFFHLYAPWYLRFNHQYLYFFFSENISKLFTPSPAKNLAPGGHYYYLFIDFASPRDAQTAQDTLNGQRGPFGGTAKIQRAREWAGDQRHRGTPAAEEMERDEAVSEIL